MKLRLLFYLIITTLIISSASELFPWFWTQAIDGNHIKYLGSLKKYEQKCDEIFQFGECKKKYSFNKSEFLKLNGETFETFGIGFFLTDFVIKCGDRLVLQNSRDIPPALILDSYKVYKTVDLGSITCLNSEPLQILSINKKGFATHGQISSNALIGTRDYIASFKRAIEFFGVGIYSVFFFAIGFSLVANRLFLKQFLSQKKEWIDGLWILPSAWALFALFKSGIFEILFLRISSIDLLFRVQTGVSVIAHALPLAASLFISKKADFKPPLKLLTSGLIIGYLPFVFSPFFNFYLIYLTLILSIISIAISISRRNFLITCFACLTIVEDLKAFGYPWLPNVSTTLTFISLREMVRTGYSIRLAGYLATANLWSKQSALETQANPSISKVLSSFSKFGMIKRISYLSLRNDSAPRLYFCDETDASHGEALYLERVPSVFAQVISTRSALFHINTNEPFARNLLQRTGKEKLGQFFSLVPVEESNRLLGILALTKYEFDPEKDENSRLKFDILVPALSESISLTEAKEADFASDNRFSKLIELVPQLADSKKWTSINDFSMEMLKLLQTTFEWEGFVGILPEGSSILEIIASSFAPNKGQAVLFGTRWEMHTENVRGPGPLALFQNKRLIVPKVDWIFESISSKTRQFIEDTTTKSICVVPFRKYSKDKFNAFGLLWIASKRQGDFDSSFERSAVLLQEILEKSLARIFQYAVEETLLVGTLRPEVHMRLMRGENPVDVGDGTLLQIDLLGSTPFSSHLGKEKWQILQKEYLDCLKQISTPYNLTAEVFIWDAIYFTSSETLSPENLIKLFSECNKSITATLERFNLTKLRPNAEITIRICVTYGDITREIRHGSWTITGSTMANVNKLEQSIKKQPIAIAASQQLFMRWQKMGILNENIRFDKNLGAWVFRTDDLQIQKVTAA